jgi:hypothetical protein
MARSRIFGILAGYEDQNNHDSLRTGPAFKVLAGRSPQDDDLASQPTLSGFGLAHRRAQHCSAHRQRLCSLRSYVVSRVSTSATATLSPFAEPHNAHRRLDGQLAPGRCDRGRDCSQGDSKRLRGDQTRSTSHPSNGVRSGRSQSLKNARLCGHRRANHPVFSEERPVDAT